MAHPVFFDPQRKRWKRLRLALNVAGVATTLLVVFFAVSIYRGTSLPDVGLPAAKHPYRPIKEAARRHYPRKPATHRRTKTAPSQVVLNADEGIRAAFYVTWDAGSFASLKEYAHQIDLLFPEWLHVLTPDGRLQAVSADNQLFPVVEHNAIKPDKVMPVDPAVMAFLKSEKLPMEVLPLVNNFDPIVNDWVSNISEMLDKAEPRAAFRKQIATYLASDNYRGLTLDLEGFPFASQAGYRALIGELAADLHAKGMKLYVAVPARNEDFDFSYIAQHSDGLILMNYDQHYPDGAAGPVASQNWFVQNLVRAIKLVPRDKIICSIANYGYDWTAARKGKPGQARIDSVQQAWLDAHDSEADIEFDVDSMNPHFSYLDESNKRHDVWFVDGVTALNQMRAANQLGINTFALWRLGSEDRSLWKVWDNPGEASAPEALRMVQPGHDVDHEGTGEVMRIEQHPTPGERSVMLDQETGLITGETFSVTPLPYQVAHYGGGQPNQIALTFDDGPDPDWTPKILDILKLQNAPATFFVIGSEAEDNPGLLRRIYREGHEIGNHTWSHPDISGINRAAMRIELNATERLFESKLGIKPIYFRPPYSIDQDPDTDDQVRPLDVMQELGYIAVGAKLDPNDWRDNPRRRSAEIVADVVRYLPPCNAEDLQRCGNIILLHDGGGNRQETVRALPIIIQTLRARGFQIVPVSTLLGKTRDGVMPLISPNERWSAWVDNLGFTALGTLGETIVLIFFVGDALMTVRLFLVGAFAMFDRFHQRRDKELAEAAHYQPDVAVLIPAFNEETVIVQTVRAALASDYPRLRVIVVDDGSSDHTLEAVQRGFPAEEAAGRVMILTKPNSGKAEALNYGLRFVTEDIFVGIDADTEIAPTAISRLVPHFLDQQVAAVAGNAKVGNRVNIWTRWQALEYITSQNFERRALNTLGAVSVVPGALGAWRTAAVRDAGGYHVDTVAEDADLTMALLRAGHRVQYEDRALAYTEAPISARGLMRQRFRWSFGILQSLWKHREVFARKGVLGLVALPNILVFQILLPLVSPFIDIMFAVGIASYLLDRYFHPQTADKASVEKLLLFFLAFLIIDFVTSAVAFALERRDEGTREDGLLLFDVWLQRFVYRQLFSVVLFKTLKRAVEGKHFAWDKLERTAGLPYARTEP
jgi:cellulose synthase/poly-beta-1,6-N-acetylglucosamine synthase-like glycosyltransferase/peptidoglycan/xylan/chitin deacetylase (PgdA/CDA1 family)/spore germination protein YaaH